MKARSVTLSAVVTIVALASSPASQVHAANITVKPGSCHALQNLPFTVPEPLRFSSGSIANPTGDSRYNVVCDVPRQPLASGATSGGFYVDGTNYPGQTTTCTITSFNYDGFFLGAVTFRETAAAYDHFVSFPASQLGTWAYVSMNCTLPASAFGELIGVTSVQ